MDAQQKLELIKSRLHGQWFNPHGDLESDIASVVYGCGPAIPADPTEDYSKEIEAARAFALDDLFIGAEPAVSVAPGGVWVAAWVWVGPPERDTDFDEVEGAPETAAAYIADKFLTCDFKDCEHHNDGNDMCSKCGAILD